MATELDLAYAHCQRVAKQSARSFYYASLPLPRDKRRAIYAVYAYCRLCDDIADGALPVDEKYRGFAEVRRNLQSSTTAGADAPMYLALRHAAETFGIPYTYLNEILQGVEMDMVKTRFGDFDELREYCYKVASVVGLVCIRIFGYTDANAEEYAVDMGLALQLTNILRDVKEGHGALPGLHPARRNAPFRIHRSRTKTRRYDRRLSGIDGASGTARAGIL